jgi:HSP20 family protein
MDIEIRLEREIGRMRERMERMVDEMFHLGRTYIPRSSRGWAPPMDIYETEDEVIILVEMAGVRKEDLEVTMCEDMLLIVGKRTNPFQGDQRKVHQMEIDFGPFERRVRFMIPVRTDGINAVYQEGFLILRIPKSRTEPGHIPLQWE